VTICIPSKRPLETSLEPLWSAINYAEARGYKVVISDNSRDPIKRDYFAGAPEHVRYIADGPDNAAENVLSALSEAESEFVLVLGDDDFINASEGSAAFDFASLSGDVTGVKPRIEIWSKEHGVTDVDQFTIDEGDAAQRVLEFTRKLKGPNSTYYSFYRRELLSGIMQLFIGHHPMQAGYSDWATVYALVATGKIAHDPSTTLRYDNSRWQDADAALETLDSLLAASELPPEASHFMSLFHFLDAYVLIFRDGPDMPVNQRYTAAYALAMVFLKRLVFRASQTPVDFVLASDLIPHLAEAVNSEDMDINKMFHIAGLIADRLKPGLKQQYDQYLLAAIHGAPAGQQTQA
jgi:hypothetical protein